MAHRWMVPSKKKDGPEQGRFPPELGTCKMPFGIVRAQVA